MDLRPCCLTVYVASEIAENRLSRSRTCQCLDKCAFRCRTHLAYVKIVAERSLSGRGELCDSFGIISSEVVLRCFCSVMLLCHLYMHVTRPCYSVLEATAC